MGNGDIMAYYPPIPLARFAFYGHFSSRTGGMLLGVFHRISTAWKASPQTRAPVLRFGRSDLAGPGIAAVPPACTVALGGEISSLTWSSCQRVSH